jgi:polyhydroxyalkanoate synthase
VILTPAGAVRAVGNVRDRVLVGPFADLRRMPRTAIDTGPEPSDGPGVGRAHGLARAGSVSTYRYAVHPTARLRGSPVLLVSPLGACGVAFDLRRGNSFVEHLVGEGRYVHQVDDEDLVGHGQGSNGGFVSSSPADLQRWVDEILPHVVRTVSAHHGGEPVHLVGWSIGGLCSVLSAAGHPELPLASLTALATPFALEDVRAVTTPRPLALGAGGPALATLQALLHLMPLPRLFRVLGLSSLDELITAPLTVLTRLDDREFLAQLEAIDDLRALLGDQARVVGTAFRQLIDPPDFADGRTVVGRRVIDLADQRTPTLLVAGEDDLVVPPHAVRLGARYLTGADVRLRTVPGGHLGLLAGRGAKSTTWAQICEFFDRHDAPAHRDGTRSVAAPPRATRRTLPSTTPSVVDESPADHAGESARIAVSRRSSRLPAPKRATRTRGQE